MGYNSVVLSSNLQRSLCHTDSRLPPCYILYKGSPRLKGVQLREVNSAQLQRYTTLLPIHKQLMHVNTLIGMFARSQFSYSYSAHRL